MSRVSRKRKVRSNPYTMGDLNKFIDDLCHPLFKEDAGFILVDGFLHGLLEQNPPLSVKKFMKYNLPKLMEELSKKRKKRKIKE